MTKDADEGFLRARTDPAVAAILSDAGRRQSERSLPKGERSKVKKARDKQAARNGKRGAYDLEPELIEAIKKIAEDEGTTASQVVGIALHMFLSERVDLSIYKVKLERNPRYEYELVWKGQEK